MKKNKKKPHFFYWFFLILIFFAFFLFHQLKNSIIIKKRGRINVIFYSSAPIFYSLSAEEVNYYLKFDPNAYLSIPGGYGYYRIGGIGKLVALENKPELFKRIFSQAVASMVDLYFYPREVKIYYDDTQKEPFFYPSFNQIFFYSTNGNLVDRLMVFIFFIKTDRKIFKEIEPIYQSNKKNQRIYDDEQFFKINQGIFYKEEFRDLKNNVQILYHRSYKTACKIAQIIEGEGIRVVDIDYHQAVPKDCLIIEDKKNPSLAAQALIQFFNCQFKTEKTEISDIILIMGNLEKEWEITTD